LKGYKNNLSIERINVNGIYEPSNCCWIPFKEQAINKRNNRKITFDRKEKTIAEWARDYSLNYKLLYRRIYGLHWPIGKALNTPSRKLQKIKEQEKKA
jgi:hypothetical protein